MDERTFLEIEDNYSLYNLEAGGVKYWKYIRYDFYEREILDNDTKNTGKMKKEDSIVSIMWHLLMIRLSNLLCWRRSDVVVFQHSRRIAENNSYVCAYTHDIGEKYKSLKVSERINGKFERLFDHSTYYLDDLFLGMGVQFYVSKIFRKRNLLRLRNEIRQQLENPIKAFEREYNIKVSFDQVADKIVKRIIKDKYITKYFIRFFRRYRPKIAVEVVSYAWHIMKMNEVARLFNCETIELQHGAFGWENIQYQYPAIIECSSLPRYFFSFSKYWFRFVDFSKSDTVLMDCGYPFHEKEMSRVRDIKRTDQRICIMFLSQTSNGMAISKAAKRASEVLDCNNFRILYKLHPAECDNWRNIYPWLVDDKIDVVDDTSKSIYEYFMQADIQVGMNSTTIYEGISCGLHTILLDNGHFRSVTLLSQDKNVDRATDTDELIRCVWKYHSHNKLFDDDKFFRHNALINIFSSIDSILVND